MQPRRILVASPIEPSGASWLLNCFVELGIRVDHKPVVDRIWQGAALLPDASRMWTMQKNGRAALNPKAAVLKKFLPALTRQADFVFRDDLSVHYVQDLPPCQIGEHSRVLMVRDPRDALYSSFRRGSPTLTFEEFLHLPHPNTLLSRSAHWALFVAAWLSLPNIHLVRFEDYKRDAEGTLRAILSALALTYTDSDIERAVQCSSFESARAAELALRDKLPFERQVANRSGKVGEGRDHPIVSPSIPEIEGATASILRMIGYDTQAPAERDVFAAARFSAAFLAFFDTVHLPDSVKSVPLDMAASEHHLFALLSLAYRLNDGVLSRAGLASAELRVLIDSLQELNARHAAWLADRLSSTRSQFGDGSSYFFQRIRAMRRPQGRGPTLRPDAGGPAQSGDPS